MTSLNNIYDSLKTISVNHGQLKGSFGFGDIWEIATSGDVKYPLMWVVPKPASVKKGEIGYAFTIIVMDRVQKGEVNEVEVLSDTMQIALDILAELKHGNSNDYEFDIKINSTLNPFTERFDDEVSGWNFDISLLVPFTADECAVPIINSPISTALLITDDACLLLS